MVYESTHEYYLEERVYDYLKEEIHLIDHLIFMNHTLHVHDADQDLFAHWKENDYAYWAACKSRCLLQATILSNG